MQSLKVKYMYTPVWLTLAKPKLSGSSESRLINAQCANLRSLVATESTLQQPWRCTCAAAAGVAAAVGAAAAAAGAAAAGAAAASAGAASVEQEASDVVVEDTILGRVLR